MKVFIVEDSEVVRERLTAMLTEANGVQVVGAAAGASEAVDAFGRLGPDAVILDLQLVEGNGFDVLRIIKKANPATLVLVLTNHASVQHREKCLQAGADFFFDKAFEFERVQQECQRWVRVNQC